MHRTESAHIKSINVLIAIFLFSNLCYSYDFIETAKEDSVDAIDLRADKKWIMQSERATPLVLPKKMFMLSTSLGLNEYTKSSGIQIRNEHVYLDFVLSPSDKFDITVISHPTFEYAIIQNVSNIGRVQYLSGLSLTIGAGFASIPIFEDFRYKVFSRMKLPFNRKSWIKSIAYCEFKEKYYSHSDFDFIINLEVIKCLNLAIGINYRNSNVAHFISYISAKGKYVNNLSANAGFNLNINRHLRLAFTIGVGREINNYPGIYPTAKGYFKAVW